MPEHIKEKPAVSYFLHGTSIDNRVWTPSVLSSISSLFGEGDIRLFGWSGANNTQARKDAAEKLLGNIDRHLGSIESSEIQLSLVGHSHGGTVLLYASSYLRELLGSGVHINILTLNTPRVAGGACLQDESICHYHVYCPKDIVAPRGGFSRTGMLTEGGERSNWLGKPIGGEWSSIREKGSGRPGSADLTFDSALANIAYADQYRFKGFDPRTHWVSHRGWLKKNVAQWLPKLEERLEAKKLKH